jgi:hypothetical protein
VYTQFKGVVLDEEEGHHIAEALGNKKVGLTPPSRETTPFLHSFMLRPQFFKYVVYTSVSRIFH